MGRLKLAVLISGRGSNLQALIDACADPSYPAEIVLVISNQASAQGLARAEAAGLATTVIDHSSYDGREAFDSVVTAAIEGAGAELVCLAGFMRLLSDEFVGHWRNHLINIHPSLLPAYRGLDVHQRVLDAGETQSGCTVHFVRAETDTGPIILQTQVPVRPGDDEGSLAARILEREHRIYPEAIRLIAEGRVNIDGLED
jgi:phosphoribosylglycinamide formyltransferase-1